MVNTDLIKILGSKLTATTSVADRLVYSIRRALDLKLSPLSMKKLGLLSDSDMEVMDAYLFRYGSLVSNIQDSIFKSIGEIEQEPVSMMSNRDKTNLMERLGALPSAQAFASLAVIRNKLMHEYPEEAEKHLERINFITKEAPELVRIFIGIMRYAKKFDISISLKHCEHLLTFGNELCNVCKTIPCVCAKSAPPPPRPKFR